jgi:CO/xanthine dehydrogenase Mo-binding subunit
MAVAPSDTIGVRRRRVDGEPKVRGAARYVADLQIRGLLHARLVLAAEAHARITSIDTAAALAVPGVVAVLTAGDLPIAPGKGGRGGEPLAREEIVYSGQPVAMVVAETQAAAEDGVDEVIVETEPLDRVVDLEAAMAPDSPLARVTETSAEASDVGEAHTAAGGGGAEVEEDLSDNVVGRARMRNGDAEAAIAGSAARTSGRFTTSWIHQGYLETQGATAWLEPEGELVVHTSTQGAFQVRRELADLLQLSHDRVRVRAATLGGGFGGKLMVIDVLPAAAALKLRRPVRLTLTRSEDFAASNPAPAQILEIETAGAPDGTLTGIRGRVVCDRGMNEEFGVESISALLATGPYRWQAFDMAAYGVLTNRVTSAAYRAPGAPPAAFAVETLLDELAERLGVDPLELRLKNALREGDMGMDGNPMPVFGAYECLERVREHSVWTQRGSLPENEGVGLAIGWWPGGLEPAAASCRLDHDGALTIVTAAVDMSGTETAFQTIAAATFGLPVEKVRVVYGDTQGAPYAGVSGGSKITYTVGRAVELAVEQAREKLLNVAAHELEISPEDLEIVDGSVQPVGAPGRAMKIEELARKVLTFGSRHEPVEGYGSTALTSRAPGAAVHVSHVRVDRETGTVTPLRHLIAQDVGRALNPSLVEGQMLGGTVQGLGWALHEELAYDEYGQLRSGTFAEYPLPSAELVPPVDLEIVEVPAPDGPFGAKGVGEPPVVAVAAAVANAVAAATGVRMRALPMSAERVWRALNGNGR